MLFKLLISAFFLFMFMGLFAHMLGDYRILFVSLGDGDVTFYFSKILLIMGT